MQTITPPLYLDWTFWAFATSALAIILSQVPPVRQWFNPGKLRLELADRVWITHMLGFPNVQVYVTLRNNGGRAVRITTMTIELFRHGKQLSSLKVQNFIASELNPQPINLTPFYLEAGREWGHRVNAFEALVAKEDRHILRVRRALKKNIGKKIREQQTHDSDAAELLVADQEVLQPIMDIFERNFIWEAGEYELTIKVGAEETTGSASGKYRFTVYDPDSEELRCYADDYKHGFGPALNYEDHAGVVCQLHPA